MAIEAQLPDGRILEFPDGTDPEVIQSAAKRLMVSPLSHVSTEELKNAPSAPFSVSDIARSGGTGVVGGLGSLAAVGGASSAPSKYLEEKTQGIQSGLSPARLAEMQRREELIRRAEESGSFFEKIKAGAGAVTEAPLQSLAQGLGSAVTPVAAAVAAVAMAPASLAAGIGVAAAAVVGGLMGAGESKKGINERVRQEFEKAGDPPDVAARKADEAQAWTGQNLDQIMINAGAGALEGATGVGRVAAGAARTARGLKPIPTKPLTAPTKLGTVAGAAVEEAAPELIQSLAGTAAGNVAASRAGFQADTFEGATSAATRDALIGALTGAAVSPVQYKGLQNDFLRQQQDEANKKQEEFQKQREEFVQKYQQQQEETKKNLGLNMLALPAPATTAEEKYRNPAATITKEEMGDEASKYVDNYRKANNLPALKAYSIEDIKDAMPGLNAEGEKGILDSILAGKYGYKPVDETTGNEIKYTSDDIMALAEEEKNIATGTQGFKDFLTSVTGTDNVGEMSQPQLHAAYSALQNFEPAEETRILPEGTAATRFSEKQYDKALKWVGVTFGEFDNKPLDPNEIVKDIKDATGLESDRDARALLDSAVKNGDLTLTTKPVFRVVDPATGKFVHTATTRAKAENYAKGKDLNIYGDSQSYISPAEQGTASDRTPLPAGYQINQERVVEGEEDLVDVMREGRGQALETIAADKAQERIDTLTGESKALADRALKRIEQDSATTQKIQKNLDQRVAKGESKTRDFEIQKTRSERAITNLRKRIQKNLDKIEELSAPIKTRKSEVKKPIIKKKLTVTKDGKAIGTFSQDEIGKANAQAQDAILTQMTDEEIQASIDDKKLGLFSKKAKAEQDRRRGPTGFKIKKTKVPETLAPEFVDQAEEIKKKLVPMLQKFGLGNVGLNIVNAIKNNAEGSYLNSLIQVAVDATSPVQTMRHEALHALKDLGFFSDSQWQALTNKAKTEWIQKYLKNQNAEFEGETMSRFDAYKKMGLTDEEIAEEAIADAFGDFDANGSPPGMMAALLKRLNQLFEALKNVITGAGFQTAESIFGKVERGELKGTKEATTEEEKLSTRPTSDIGHKREASTGRYVGAPDWVGDSPQRLTALRKKLKKLAIEGEVGRYWYENSSQAVMDMTGNKKDAEKFVGLLAIYSAHSTVAANTSKALNAWYQYKTGQPINAGDTIQDQKAEELLRQDKYWSGIKTNSFYQNLMIEIDPSKIDPKTATMDMWMAIAFDYGSEKLDQGPKYGFALRETQRLAEELGWTPHQTQAAIWTAIKGRVEATRDKIRTKDVERGNIEVSVGKNAKPVYILKPEGRYDHYRLAHQIGMDHNLTEQELLDSSYDFATALDERTAQVSWEATPGETTGVLPGLLKAPTKQKLEYLEAVSEVLRDQDGNDAIAVRIGLPAGKELLGFSAWKGDIGAGVQSFFPASVEGVGERREARQEAKDLLNLYANIRGFVLIQEAVVWHIPMFDGSKKNQNGYEGVFNEPLTEAEMKALYTGLHEKFNTWEIAPGYTENGFRALNFTNVDNKTFQRGIREVLASMPKDFGGGQLEGLAFRSTGDYIGNDWETSPKGEDYARNIASAADPNRPAGSPDLQTWATDLRSRVEKVNEDFSKKYNWGKPKLSLRVAETLTRPSVSGEGIVLGEKQPASMSYRGIHYGQAKVDELDGKKFGTGIRGAERRRLEDAFDDRIKNRVYFYITKPDGTLPLPESGLGGYVYTQQFDNILPPGSEMSQMFSSVNGDANNFETAVIDAGYDGYAVPSMGMMVVLNHNTPVKYEGTRGELMQKGEKLSLKKTVGLADARINKLIDTFIYLQNGAEKKTKGNIAYVSPRDFLNATIPPSDKEILESEKEPLDIDRLSKTLGPIGLQVEPTEGRKYELNVTGHEGRHRMMALRDAGVESVPVLFEFTRGENREPIDDLFIHPQKFGKDDYGIRGFVAYGLEPINYENKDVIKQKFSEGDIKFSLKKVDQLFDKADDIPESEGVEIIRSNWVGGVSGLGERDSAYDLYRVNGGKKYMSAVQDLVRKELGDNFKGYRLMHKDELEEIQTGAMGSQLASFTLRPDIAQSFANLATYRKVPKDKLKVVEMDLTPEHVWMIGHPAEKELVIDYGQGYNPEAVVEYREKLSLRSTRQPPESKEFKQWFGNSYFTSGGEPLIMYHGTARDITIFKGKQAKAIFVTTKPEVAESYAGTGVEYMRTEAYKALTRDEKVELITVVAEQAERDGEITKAELKEIQSNLKKRVPTVEKNSIIGLPYQIEGEVLESLNNLLPTKGNIMPVYVNARNVFDYANKDHVNKVIGWMENNSRVLGSMQYPEQWLKKVKDLVSRGNWVRIESEDVQEAIRALDFDGFSVLEAGTKNYAVYNATNIKSVTGNIGTFGLGEVTSEQAKQFGMTAEQAKQAQEEGDIRFSLKANLPANIAASIEKTTTVREEKGFAERMMEAISPKGFSSWRAEAVNRYNALSIADKIKVKKRGGVALYADQSAEAAALMSDNAAGVAASAMGVHDRRGGVPVFRNGVTTIDGSVEGIVSIFAPLAKYKDPFIYQMYQFYSGAKRARRYLDKGIEKNYDANDIAYANQLGKQYPEFEDIFKKWDKYNKGLVKYQVDTGVLSAAEGAEYIKYSDYVPFYRQLEGEKTFGPNVFQSISGVKKPKKYTGGEAPVADFMETIVRNTQSAIQAGMKNTAAKMAVDTFVEIDQAELAPDGTTGEDVVHVLENGVKKSYLVFDSALVQSVMSLNLPDLPFIGFFAGPANLLRNLVTKDPGFMLANMVRDSMSAWVTSGVKMTPVASAIKNFTGALRGTAPEYQALLNAGILGGYEYSQGVEVSAANMKKALGKYAPSTSLDKLKGVPTSLWESLEKGTMASDAATRMEVYKNVLAETGNEAEALYRAQEVMNFQRKGRSAVVRVLTAAVPFLNARIQGLDVLYRAMSGQMGTVDAKKIQKAFFVRGASIMAMSMIYWALTHDDDEYKKQEQETRDNYWLIPSMGIKIPIPFEVGVIFKVIPERIAEYFLGNDTGKDFADSMKRNFMNTFAFNLIPQTVLPIYEAKTNYSFFTQRNIIGAGLEGVAPEYQVGPSTSQLAAFLGKELGYSPMLIDHVIGGYTGTFGSYVVDVIDAIAFANADVQRPSKRFEQLPVFKRFLLDPQAKGNVTAYYDLKNAVDEAVRTSNFLEKTSNFEEMGKYNEETLKVLASKEFISDMERDMKELREMSTFVRSSTLSPDDKRDMLMSITDAENAMTANVKYLRKLMD